MSRNVLVNGGKSLEWKTGSELGSFGFILIVDEGA